LVLLALGSPWVAGHDPYTVDLSAYRKPPSVDHLLGTDSSGRDVFARLLYGARISLSVGVVAVSVYTTLGLIMGSLAGYYGGWVDSLLMRLADVVMAFPSLVLIITIASVVGPSIYNVMLVIGLLGWPPIARIVRGMFLSLRKREFVVAAQATGVENLRLIWRHMIPNVLAPVIVAATYGMASAILIEAGLSFLGLGVQPPTASWGNMLNAAQSISILEGMPWLWVSPGLMIAITVLSLNFLGDGLRDALDPHQTF
jgi:peptide/nickel transport system permease protein